jgi:hypothetical protein
MRFKRLQAAGFAAVAAGLTLLGGPAHADSGTRTQDALGIDYDPACVASTRTVAPAANSIDARGCDGITSYDGSATAIDIGARPVIGPIVVGEMMWCPPYGFQTYDLCLYYRTHPGTGRPWLGGGIYVSATKLPQPGSVKAPDGTDATLDTPSPAFTGANYYNLFQNKSVQTNTPVAGSGCTSPSGAPVFDQHGSWRDGSHFFTNLNVSWSGGRWVWRAEIGEYSPGPNGGFSSYELGRAERVGQDGVPVWTSASDHLVKGVNWDVTVTSTRRGTAINVEADAVFETPDTVNCREGFFKHAYVRPGDIVANAKGLTTVDQAVALPVSVPLSASCGPTAGIVCAEDIPVIGGFTVVGDVTDGNSTPGPNGSNIAGIAYTPGLLGAVDTLGDGPTCPTPTFGGRLQPNPLFVPDAACQLDDDAIGRGSVLSELWDTNQGFAATP